MNPQTVPIDANVRMATTAPIQHMCPFVQEVDNGHIEIVWDANGWTFELHALRDYLNTFTGREISHEALTEEVRAELNSHHGINIVTVESKWRTAGMEVKCFSSPTLADQP